MEQKRTTSETRGTTTRGSTQGNVPRRHLEEIGPLSRRTE